jgi:hypothetical protein
MHFCRNCIFTIEIDTPLIGETKRKIISEESFSPGGVLNLPEGHYNLFVILKQTGQVGLLAVFDCSICFVKLKNGFVDLW